MIDRIRPGRLWWERIEDDGPFGPEVMYIAVGIDLTVTRHADGWSWSGAAPMREAPELAMLDAEEWAVQDTIDRLIALGGGVEAVRAEKQGRAA